MEKKENVVLSSSESTKTSLEAVRTGCAGLSVHRKKLLERVPKSGNWCSFPYASITTKDIAYLSAATQHEFALLRGKKEDILFHGVELHCIFPEKLVNSLMEHKLELVAHTHPDWGIIIPSKDDRNFLKRIGQKKSIIISYITGMELQFNSNEFDDIM